MELGELSAGAPGAYLLHGPGAVGRVREVAAAYLVVQEVECAGGLRAEAAREVASALGVVVPGGVVGVVVVGPLDGSTPRAADSLLKAAEEMAGTVSLLAWAADEAAVPATLRSRCRRVYCPGSCGVAEEAASCARAVVEALEAGERWRVVEAVRGVDVRDLAQAVAELGASGETTALRLWPRLRGFLVDDRPRARPAVLSAVLGS